MAKKILPFEKLDDAITCAKNLLRQEEGSEIPLNVLKTIRFLYENKVGFILSRNLPVHSCREARTHRWRIGYRGIPLCDELKSIIGKIASPRGSVLFVAVHCRGDKEIDLAKVPSALQTHGTFEVIEKEDLLNLFGMEYGTVNPFLLEVQSKIKIKHLFDKELLKTVVRIPGTMMTNAGDFTWAIEFDPRELIESVKSKVVASIAVPFKGDSALSQLESVNPRSIGIVTIKNAETGIALLNIILGESKKILRHHFYRGDLSNPEVHAITTPGGKRMNILNAVQQMCRSRVSLLCTSVQTTNYLTQSIKRICARYGVTFISISDVVKYYLMKKRIKSVALLGAKPVADVNQQCCPYRNLRGIRVERLSNSVFRNIEEMEHRIAQAQDPPFETFQDFVSLVNSAIKSDTIVLVSSELSILYNRWASKEKSRRQIVDSLNLYGRAIALASLKQDWMKEL